MEYELFEDKNKPYKKRKLHDLLDKYGTIEELEQHGSVEDNFDYMFAGQRELLDEVLEERRENTGLKAENENYDEAENLTEKRQKTAVNLQKKLLEDDSEQEKQKSGAHVTLPATSRSSLDDEDMAKNAAKHPMYQTASEKEVESLRARSLADRVKENQSAENEYNRTKSDGGKNSQVDYSKYGSGFTREFIDEMLNDREFFNILHEYIIPNEGGYKNDSDDTGGETNMGISKTTHKTEDIKNLTRERANAIYYRDYYKWNGLNKLPYPIRGFVVDYGLPTYPQFALKTVHKILGIPKEATIIGPTTLQKFDNYSETDYNNFLNNYKTEMIKHYHDVVLKNPAKRKFLKGWLNRAEGAHLAK